MSTPILRLRAFLEKVLQQKDELYVLEAGCGSASHFPFEQRVRLCGIDISEKQLRRNLTLDERIVGDLQTHEWPPTSFDVIICWTVLEHLMHPELALDKFERAVKPGGVIVLGLPNLYSIKGMATKFLPQFIHVWYYRYVFGRKDAGAEDVGPFKTYLKMKASPKAIREFARKRNLEVVYFDTFDPGDFPDFLRKNPLARLVRFLYNSLRYFFRILSAGILGDSDFVIVLRK